MKISDDFFWLYHWACVVVAFIGGHVLRWWVDARKRAREAEKAKEARSKRRPSLFHPLKSHRFELEIGDVAFAATSIEVANWPAGEGKWKLVLDIRSAVRFSSPSFAVRVQDLWDAWLIEMGCSADGTATKPLTAVLRLLTSDDGTARRFPFAIDSVESMGLLAPLDASTEDVIIERTILHVTPVGSAHGAGRDHPVLVRSRRVFHYSEGKELRDVMLDGPRAVS